MLTHFIIITHQSTGKLQIVLQSQSETCKILQSIQYPKIKIHFSPFRKSMGPGKISAGTGITFLIGPPIGSRTTVTGNIWASFIRTSRSSTKPLTHWILERQDLKHLNTLTGKYILFNTYYAQLNYVHTLTHFTTIIHQHTGKTSIALQNQSEKRKITQSIHYSKIKIHLLSFRKNVVTGKKCVGTDK